MLASTRSRACWQEVHLVCSHWDRFSFHMWPVASRTWSKRSRRYATVETCRTWFSVFVILNHQARFLFPVPTLCFGSEPSLVLLFLISFDTFSLRRRDAGWAVMPLYGGKQQPPAPLVGHCHDAAHCFFQSDACKWTGYAHHTEDD